MKWSMSWETGQSELEDKVAYNDDSDWHEIGAP